MIILLTFAFISGLVTILAPCIWPLLPIILSSSIGGKGHKRPLGITLGIMLSFAVFTLSVSTLVMIFHFDPTVLRIFAVVVIGFLGLTMVIPQLTRVVELLVSRLSLVWGQKRQLQGNDFRTGFITGMSLGIVWSPCAGPILAAIATLAATSQITINLVLITIAYVTGVGIPLFFFAYGGQRIVSNTRFISKYTGQIQRVFGVIMILTALAIYTNYDKTIQAKLLDAFPQYGQALVEFENSEKIKEQLDILRGRKGKKTMKDIKQGSRSNLPKLGIAPELTGISKWLNTDRPLTMRELRGKVVLIDFWTYTCINCIRTLPHVTSWYDKYKDKGFIVIGVHTPEFEFEKKSENVEQAIKQYNIHYPVPQDNDYETWNAWDNRYWPAKYLVDKDGNLRYYHFGEGKYEETEKAIQELLKETGKQVTSETLDMPDKTPTTRNTPETYLGSKRMEFFFPTWKVGIGIQSFELPGDTPADRFSLGGEWRITDEYAISSKKSVMVLNFNAEQVFLVMRPGDVILGTQSEARRTPESDSGQARMTKRVVKVYLDGKLVDESNGGIDVKNGIVTVTKDDIHHLIDLPKKGNHILRLEFTPGIECYAFTFG